MERKISPPGNTDQKQEPKKKDEQNQGKKRPMPQHTNPDNDTGSVQEIQVKQKMASSRWIWGAFKLPGRELASLHRLWCERQRSDQYLGTLVNAYLSQGGAVLGIKRGDTYVDVGTMHGYREAVGLLSSSQIAA